MNKFKAFCLGFLDALGEQGLQVGLTWDDDLDMNEAYDTGANWGERVAAPFWWLRRRVAR